MDVYLLLFLFFIVAPIGTFIHETGHAFGAKMVKADQMLVTIGQGKRIATFNWSNICIHLHLLYFMGGSNASNCQIPYKVKDIIWITICGPLNNIVFALGFYLLYIIMPSPYMYILFLFNVWIAFINIIPFKIKQKQSDGYIIFKAIIRRESMFK